MIAQATFCSVCVRMYAPDESPSQNRPPNQSHSKPNLNLAWKRPSSPSPNCRL